MNRLRLIFLLALINSLPCRQFMDFGRNKVQFDEFDWKALKTEHFDIYYYDEMLGIAKTCAFIAEEAFKEYSCEFYFALNAGYL